MSRIEILTAALEKSGAAIKRLLSAPSSPKRDAALRTDLGSYMRQVEELSKLAEAAAPADTEQPGDDTPTAPIDVQWENSPWPRPTTATTEAILAKYDSTPENVDNSLLSQVTPEENVILGASGYFGNPRSPVGGANYARYSGVVGDSSTGGITVLYAYRDGQLIASKEFPGDRPPNTNDYWYEVTQP